MNYQIIKSFLKSCVLFALSLILASCGGLSESEETADVVRSANNLLSSRNCDAAISLLESHGMKNKDARYLQALASGYACKAGYDEPTFYGLLTNTDLTGGSAGLIDALVRLSYAPMTSPTDDAYINLKTAIEILIWAGDVSTPSADNRGAEFNSKEASELNEMALYLLFTQIGKYAFYYGNADPTAGEKGTGTIINGNSNGNTNECFTTYTNTAARAIITGATTTPCDDGDPGHPSLTYPGITHELYVKRLCEGVVLFNNFVDVLNAVVLPADSGSIGDVQADLSTIFTAACGATGSNLVCTIKSQTECETEFAADTSATPALNTGSNVLQLYFAGVYETLFAN